MGQVKSMIKSAVCGPGSTKGSRQGSEGEDSETESQYGQYRPLREPQRQGGSDMGDGGGELEELTGLQPRRDDEDDTRQEETELHQIPDQLHQQQLNYQQPLNHNHQPQRHHSHHHHHFCHRVRYVVVWNP